mgnify:CR=1 FL=1
MHALMVSAGGYWRSVNLAWLIVALTACEYISAKSRRSYIPSQLLLSTVAASYIPDASEADISAGGC